MTYTTPTVWQLTPIHVTLRNCHIAAMHYFCLYVCHVYLYVCLMVLLFPGWGSSLFTHLILICPCVVLLCMHVVRWVCLVGCTMGLMPPNLVEVPAAPPLPAFCVYYRDHLSLSVHCSCRCVNAICPNGHFFLCSRLLTHNVYLVNARYCACAMTRSWSGDVIWRQVHFSGHFLPFLPLYLDCILSGMWDTAHVQWGGCDAVAFSDVKCTSFGTFWRQISFLSRYTQPFL